MRNITGLFRRESIHISPLLSQASPGQRSSRIPAWRRSLASILNRIARAVRMAGAVARKAYRDAPGVPLPETLRQRHVPPPPAKAQISESLVKPPAKDDAKSR